MSKIALSVLMTLVLALTVTGVVFAQIVTVQQLPTSLTTASQVFIAINNVANWVFTILLIASVFIVILAGFTFVTAGGDPESISKARTQLIYAAVGIIVALLARGFPTLIQGFIE